MKALLEAKRLRRRFGRSQVVRDVSFKLHQGEVLAFLGPNGAGKSTTMRMLSGTLAPTEGRVLIAGIDPLEQPLRAKALLGYLPENPPLYNQLTVDEYLNFCARLRAIPRRGRKSALARSKARCGLEQVGRRLIANLSKGYRQRVGIAQAIIHEPRIVILDEPTSGLDPNQIQDIRQLIRELGSERGVILSTHILPEVQAVCDRVMILNQGQLVFSGNLSELHPQEKSSLIIQLDNPPETELLGKLPGVTRVDLLEGKRYRLQLGRGTDHGIIAEHIVRHGWILQALCPEQQGLEQIFTRLTTGEGPA
jgi:ABC-2 type transport system ATP-binding protein